MSNGDAPQKSTLILSIQGFFSTCSSVTTLLAVAYFLDVRRAVAVALGLQAAVALLHGLPFNSEKFYDLSGSFTHFAVVASSLLFEARRRTPRQLFAALASVMWMTRLGTFLYTRILRDGKDTRFDEFKRARLAFVQVWALQAVWVMFAELPVVLINNRDDDAPTTAVDVLAMLAWSVGFLIEAAADSQKMAFRDDPQNKDKFITTGIWRYSRHPNYFGEILMWSALACLASSAAFHLSDPYLHAAWISPGFSALLLLFVSGVPMVEEKGMAKWGKDAAYLEYVRSTSCVVPWFPGTTKKGD